MNTYKHLKNCRVCNDFYTAFKRAALAKDYDDYVMKFESDCPKTFDKESFDNIKNFFSDDKLRLLRKREKCLESLLEKP